MYFFLLYRCEFNSKKQGASEKGKFKMSWISKVLKFDLSSSSGAVFNLFLTIYSKMFDSLNACQFDNFTNLNYKLQLIHMVCLNAYQIVENYFMGIQP